MSIRKALWFCAAVCFSLPAFANQEALLRDGHPERYRVRKGDTLWDIAERFLQYPWLWPAIWHLNPEIRDPHLIYPDDVVSLAYIDGEPRLTVRSEDRIGETVRLSPGIREETVESAIPAIPLEAIRPFLTETRIVEDDILDSAPYILATADERVMSAARDVLYARGLGEVPLERYSIVRKGDLFVDPETSRVLGREARHIGEAVLVSGGDPATLRVVSSSREILAGDRLLPPADEGFQGAFVPGTPAVPVEGRIIAVLDGVTQIGQFSVVVLNRGKDHRLETGDVLAVYKAGAVVRDTIGGRRGEAVRLPGERAGELIVFRVFDGMSLGLVMNATRAMHVQDAVRNP